MSDDARKMQMTGDEINKAASNDFDPGEQINIAELMRAAFRHGKAFIIFATGIIGSRLLWGITMSEPPITSVADMLFGGALFWLIYYLTQKTDTQR